MIISRLTSDTHQIEEALSLRYDIEIFSDVPCVFGIQVTWRRANKIITLNQIQHIKDIVSGSFRMSLLPLQQKI